MTYTVMLKGAPPPDLARRLSAAHAEAIVRRSASGGSVSPKGGVGPARRPGGNEHTEVDNRSQV